MCERGSRITFVWYEDWLGFDRLVIRSHSFILQILSCVLRIFVITAYGFFHNTSYMMKIESAPIPYTPQRNDMILWKKKQDVRFIATST